MPHARPPAQISEALVIHPIRSNASAFLILDSELAAAVSTEGEFVQIPSKVLFAVLIDAYHTALEDGTPLTRTGGLRCLSSGVKIMIGIRP
jgi:hypothetical protein